MIFLLKQLEPSVRSTVMDVQFHKSLLAACGNLSQQLYP